MTTRRPLVWLSRERPQTPPVGREALQQMGVLLELLQRGERISMPHSRPMPAVGPRCHELRVRDAQTRLTWRLVYRLDPMPLYSRTGGPSGLSRQRSGT